MLPGIPQPVHSPGIHNLQLEEQKVGIKSCVDLLGNLQLPSEEIGTPAVSSTSGISSAAVCEVPGKFWMLLRLRVCKKDVWHIYRGYVWKVWKHFCAFPKLVRLSCIRVCVVYRKRVWEWRMLRSKYCPALELICCSVLQIPQNPWNTPKMSGKGDWKASMSAGACTRVNAFKRTTDVRQKASVLC